MHVDSERWIYIVWLSALVLLLIVSWMEKGREREFWLGRLVVLFTFLAGVAAFGHELLKGQREVAEEGKRTQKMVQEIQRVLGRLELIRASFKISVPMVHEDFRRYLSYIKGRAATCLVEQPQGFGRSSPLLVNPFCLPEREQNPVAHRVFSIADLCLEFFKEPIDHRLYDPCSKGAIHRPALSMKVRGGFKEKLELGYDELRKRFVLQVLRRESRPQEGRGNITITSVGDLDGAQMFVSFTNYAYGVQGVESIYRAAELDSLVLTAIPNLELYLSNDTMSRSDVGPSMPFYYTYLAVDPTNGDIFPSKLSIAR